MKKTAAERRNDPNRTANSVRPQKGLCRAGPTTETFSLTETSYCLCDTTHIVTSGLHPIAVGFIRNHTDLADAKVTELTYCDQVAASTVWECDCWQAGPLTSSVSNSQRLHEASPNIIHRAMHGMGSSYRSGVAMRTVMAGAGIHL